MPKSLIYFSKGGTYHLRVLHLFPPLIITQPYEEGVTIISTLKMVEEWLKIYLSCPSSQIL